VERPASKPPLITPSASPPSSRSFFHQPYRIPDRPSPSKRPRLASTSSHLQSHLPSASSSSTSLDQIDVHQAREASTLRLFDVWSTLADRYSRPLDEDDIIDITTGEVVKDRGVLRGSRNWNIGCFADHVEEDGEEEEEEEEEDDDVDELDSFANPGGDESDGVPLGVDGRVPPVTEMDPADAEDLKQFLEAERRRREICGSEEETEDSEEEGLGLVDSNSRDSVHSEGTNASSRGRGATPQAEKEDSLDGEIDHTPRREPSVYVDSGSDDELVNWDIDEASMIYRLPKKENDEDDYDCDSDIEFIEGPVLHPPSPSPPRTKPKPKPKASKNTPEQSVSKSTSKTSKLPRTQLQTPPQSQSSFNSSSTPSNEPFDPLPPGPSLDPWSSSPAHYSHDDSSPTKPPQTKPRLRKSDSRPSQVNRQVLAPPIPRLDLAKIAQGRAASKSISNPKPIPHSRAKENTSEPASTLSTPAKAVDQGRQDGVPEPLSRIGDKPLAPKRSRSHVEVVIEQRSPFSARTPVPGSHVKDQPISMKGGKTSATNTSGGGRDYKGKGREVVVEDPQEDVSEADDESDDPISILSSSPVSVSKGKGRSHSLNREDPQSSSDAVLRSTENEEQMSVIEPPKVKSSGVAASAVSMGTRKRKRLVSSSSEFETADLDSVQKLPVASSTAQSKTAARREELSVSGTRSYSIGSESSVSMVPEGMFIFWLYERFSYRLRYHQNLRRDISRQESRRLSLGRSPGQGQDLQIMTVVPVQRPRKKTWTSCILITSVLPLTSILFLIPIRLTTLTINHRTPHTIHTTHSLISLIYTPQ
jgi:Centromere protein Scm3